MRKAYIAAIALFVRFSEQIAQLVEPSLPRGTPIFDPLLENGKPRCLDAAGAYPTGFLGVD
jgi:hypothetical protein